MVEAIKRLQEQARMARLIKRMHQSGLNIAQLALVINHHSRRGQLHLLFAEWEV